MDWVNTVPDEVAAVGIVQGFADAIAWGALASVVLLVPLLVLISRVIRRRRFWCPLERREVEVRFEEHGLPGLPYTVRVSHCSVFDPPTAVACGRRCLDSAFRRQWPSGLPIMDGAGRKGRRVVHE